MGLIPKSRSSTFSGNPPSINRHPDDAVMEWIIASGTLRLALGGISVLSLKTARGPDVSCSPEHTWGRSQSSQSLLPFHLYSIVLVEM